MPGPGIAAVLIGYRNMVTLFRKVPCLEPGPAIFILSVRYIGSPQINFAFFFLSFFWVTSNVLSLAEFRLAYVIYRQHRLQVAGREKDTATTEAPTPDTKALRTSRG